MASMSSDRDMIAAMVAERIAPHLLASRSEVQAIADDVMTLFEVHREQRGEVSWITLTLAPVYSRDALDPQRPAQGTGGAT